MKRLAFFLAAALLLSGLPAPARAEGAPGCAARAAVLMHLDSGEVLYERNADARMLIASTTKILTALVVLERCALDEEVRIDARSAGVEGSSMYLRAGERYTVEELLYGLLLVSGNDAATALALHAAGSIEDFAALMNETAAALGMAGSSFRNPHGLDEEGHYSTARDMAVLAAYCMGNEDFARIAAARSHRVGEQTLYNHNKLLARYDGCVGLKTGYTKAAGRTLVTCAQRGDAAYVCVTLDDPDDWEDHRRLYDWAFSSFRCEAVLSPAQAWRVPAVSGERDSCAAVPAERVCLLLEPGAEVSYDVELPRFAFAPLRAGETAGRVTALADGVPVASCALVYAEDLPLEAGLSLSVAARLRRAWSLAARAGPYYLVGDR